MRKPRKTKAEKLADIRVEQAYSAECTNVQIPLLEITKIFDLGRRVVSEGGDDTRLRSEIKSYVATIRTN